MSALLAASLAFRLWADIRPPRELHGWEEFEKQAALLESRWDHGPQAIELNGADSLSLLPLPGIGPVYASRILKYRDLLGGYLRADQLLEVYGMDSTRYVPLVPLVRVDPSGIRPLQLNAIGFRDLLRHPYLEFEDVRALLNYRDRRGAIAGPHEIREHALLADSCLKRVQPYLRFD